MSITCLYCFLILMVDCQAQVGNLISIAQNTTALFVFGDSTVDCASGSEPMFFPYGIDSRNFPERLTNGYTIADELGLILNLTETFPYWIIDLADCTPIDEHAKGFSYGSAPAGILPATGSANDGTINMQKQIELFDRYAKVHFTPRHRSAEGTSEHLSKSVFTISVGVNDFLENYADGHNHSHISKEYSRDEFSSLLISELQKYIMELYKLGARMIIVFEIGPVECYPVIVGKDKPEGWCSNELNDMITQFNGKLYYKLIDLSSTLEGTNFFVAKTYRLLYDMVEYPYKYNLDDTKHPCCKVNETEGVYCIANQQPCDRRDLHLFWDKQHLTGKANKLIVSRCLTDSSICLPITFQKFEGALITVSGQLGRLRNVFCCICLLFVQSIVITNFHYLC